MILFSNIFYIFIVHQFIKESMCKIKQLALSFLYLFIPYFSYCQCTPAPPLFMQNPSFEGPRQAHQTPGPWQTCQVGQTPDTQPGNWGVTLAPSNGNSYLGLVAQYANNNPNSGQLIWQEGASQALSGPLVAGTEYSFTVDLSNSNSTGGGIQPGCAEVQIYGGFGRCDKGQLLWSSGNLTNYDQWLTFAVDFIPTQNFTWFSFIINPLGCSALPYVLIDNITPVQPKTVKATLNLLQGVLCNGGNSASIKTSVKGDNKPFTYNWSAPIGNRLNDSVYQNLSAGWQSVTVTDSKGCTSTDSILISQPPPFALADKMVIDANCFGNGGSAMLQYRGATPKSIYPFYDYYWSNGSTKSGTQTPLSPGFYYLTVTDSNNCSIKDTVKIDIGAGFMVDTLIRRNNCLTATNNIDIALTPIGGTAPFTYIWNTVPVQNTSTASNLNTGNYSVTITDNLGCKDTLTFSVLTPPKGVFVGYTKTDIKCNGQNTGNITLNVTAINPISTYTWSPNVSSTSTATNLAAGVYRVTVLDNKGCQDTATITLTQPPPMVDTTKTYDVRCFGQDGGYIDVKMSGGTRPYTYLWSTLPAQTDSIAKNLTAGSYSLTVTDSNSCVYTLSRNITQPTQPLQATFNFDTLKCFGDTTAFLQINLSGGTPGYFYEWSTDTSFIGNTPRVDNLGTGVYYIKGSDINGCAIFDTFFVDQPDDYKHPSFTAVNVCRDKPLQFINTTDTLGGVASLTWSWSFGDGGMDSIYSPSHAYAVADTFSVKLIANTNGCRDSITKTVRTFFVPIANFSLADVCQKDSVMILNSSNIGGGNMAYSWDFDNGSTGTQSAPSFKLKYATPGYYTLRLTLTSDSLCTDTLSRVVHIKKSYVADFIASKVCEQDSTVFINTTDTTGGVALAWAWNYGDNTTASVFQQNKIYASGGTYPVQLHLLSAEGCSDSTTKNVRVNFKPIPLFSLADVCQKDSVTILNSSNIGGGNMAYSWDFDNGSTGTQSAPSFKLKYATPGYYTLRLTLTSDSLCTDTLSRVVHIKKSYVADFIASKVCEQDSTVFINTTDTTGGVALAWAWNYGDNTTASVFQQNKIYASGGTYPVQLHLLSAEGCSDSTTKNVRVNFKPTASFNTTNGCLGLQTIFNNTTTIGGGSSSYSWDYGDGSTGILAAHTYTAINQYTVVLTATSDSACVDTAIRNVSTYEVPVANFRADSVCKGTTTAFIDQTNSGTFTIHTWTWNFGDNGQSGVQNPLHTYANASSYNVQLIVNTTNNCADTVVKSVTVNELPAIKSVLQNESCFGAKDGAINITPIKGKSPFLYAWQPNSTVEDQLNISAGKYAVLYTDANGCVGYDTFVITSPEEIFIDPFTNDVICFGESNGVIRIDAYGGVAPLSYLWSNGATNTFLQNLKSGNYSLTVRDANGCTKDTLFVINQPNPLAVNILVPDTLELGESIVLNATTQTNGGNISYAWSPANGLSCTDCENPTASPFKNTVYTLVITDDSGCKASSKVTVYVAGEHVLYVPNAFTPNEDYTNDKFNGYTKGYKNFSLTIFNRWGEKVYETNLAGDNNDANKYGWDGVYKGELQPPGVYVFAVEVEYLDGFKTRQRGSVTLIR